MSELTVSSHTNFRALHIQFLSIVFYFCFGYHKVDFTTAYMEKNIE